MDCIPYINDLMIEIDVLKDLKNNIGADNSELDKLIGEKEQLIAQCKENLSKLSKNSISYRIYLKILSGKKPSSAIREIADENYMNDIKPTSERAIYKNYYRNLKKILKSSVKIQ